MAKRDPRGKDYSGWRLSHANTEVIDGRKETIVKSWTDTDGILDDLRKQPIRFRQSKSEGLKDKWKKKK